ncbi:MAG: DNA helicase UvrD, partial [Candidatus Omnitrophota bacterium]
KKDKSKFLFTIEYFPEEGKYHWDGHRKCNARLSPKETKKLNGLCPVCGRKVTVGVSNRVEALSDREDDFTLDSGIPFKHMVPLDQIIGDAFDVSPGSVSVQKEYNAMLAKLGTEFDILLDIPEEDLVKSCQPKVASGILKVRGGRVEVAPGYDGEYGTVRIFAQDEDPSEKQLTFF